MDDKDLTKEEPPGGGRPMWRGFAKVGAVLAGFVLLAYACTANMGGGGNAAASECRSLASDLYGGGSGQYTEVTFTDGDFIKGRVVQIRDGEDYPHHYWECSYESGEPVMTFDSPAAG